MLELKNINLTFDEDCIVDGYINVPDGEITVVAGKSGSGKSSLLYDIAFITNQAIMDYKFQDIDVANLNKQQKELLQRKSIAFVFQNVQLIDRLNLMENIQFFSYLTHEEFQEDVARSYLTDLNLYLDDYSDISILSGGERQRLAIVCALMKDTPLIILDEPTAYLDYDNQLKFLDILSLLKNKYHKTILIASHDSLIKDMCDNLYEIQNQHIVQITYTNHNHQIKSLLKQSVSYKKALHLFYQKIMKSFQWKHSLVILLLTIIFSFSSLMAVFFQIYQKQISTTIQEIQSQQIVFETSISLDNETIKELEYIENVKDIKRFYPIETDNNYLLCPYVSSDYFHHYINNQNKQNEIYGNYELYRKNKSPNVNCIISNQIYSFSINSYLNQSFEDYRGFSHQSQVIYIPYQQYMDIVNSHQINLKSSTLFIMQITDQKYYLEIIEKIMRDYPDIHIQGNSNLLKLIDVQNQLKIFHNKSFIFVFGLLIITIMILKILEHYQWRKNNVFLEINGISKSIIMKMFIKKELVLLGCSFLLSIFITNGLYFGLGIINFNVISQLFLCLLCESFFIFIISCIIYKIIELSISTIYIIKEF